MRADPLLLITFTVRYLPRLLQNQIATSLKEKDK
jgi:hypothetical protein